MAIGNDKEYKYAGVIFAQNLGENFLKLKTARTKYNNQSSFFDYIGSQKKLTYCR